MKTVLIIILILLLGISCGFCAVNLAEFIHVLFHGNWNNDDEDD